MRAKFGGAFPRPDWTESATKWTACIDEMTRGIVARQGQIIFCQFRDEMDRVESAALDAGASVFSIRGGMSTQDIGHAVASASASAAAALPVVVVVQIVSGGCGLNLQFCSRILFLSQHWNPAVVHQAVGRALRIGQSAVVQVHLFRIVDDVLDNIDRRMVQIHLSKIRVARKICPSLYSGYAPLQEEDFLTTDQHIAAATAAATVAAAEEVAEVAAAAAAAAEEDPSNA